MVRQSGAHIYTPHFLRATTANRCSTGTMVTASKDHKTATFEEAEKALGYGRTRNGTLPSSVPAGVVTWILPLVAPFGTVAVIIVGEMTVNVAAAPLKVTLVAPARLLPRIWMSAPARAAAACSFTKGLNPTDTLYTVPPFWRRPYAWFRKNFRWWLTPVRRTRQSRRAAKAMQGSERAPPAVRGLFPLGPLVQGTDGNRSYSSTLALLFFKPSLLPGANAQNKIHGFWFRGDAPNQSIIRAQFRVANSTWCWKRSPGRLFVFANRRRGRVKILSRDRTDSRCGTTAWRMAPMRAMGAAERRC